MATIKFSAFTNEAVDAATTELVGYKVGDATANYRYTIAQLATAISPLVSVNTLYTADETMPLNATRTVTANGTSNIIFTGGGGNSIQIGDLTGVAGIGWKIDPATGNASGTRMAISDTNGRNILSKHSDIYNNYGSSARAIALGWGTSDVDGGIRVAINQPFSYNNNLPYYTAANIDGSSLWVFGGVGSGSVYNKRAITAFGPMGNSSDVMYALSLHNWPGDQANPYIQDLLKVSNAGTVEIGLTGQYQTDSTKIPAPVLKVNGQAYSVLYAQPNNNLTFDWNESNIQTVTALTGAHTFTPTNPKIGATYIITLAQTGAVTPNWNSLVKWPAATAPTLTGAGKTDIITLICYNETGAGLYYGTSTLDFTT